MIQRADFSLADLVPFISWTYFFHAWGFAPRFAAVARQHDCPGCRATWLASFDETERPKAAEAARLYDDALALLRQQAPGRCARGCFGLFPAWADGDDLLLLDDCGRTHRLPCLRQQRVVREGDPYLCLADFVRPLGGPEPDRVGLFVTTAGETGEQPPAPDDYRHLLAQTLADRLAEAAAERLHRDVRRIHWGYAPDERLTPDELLAERYQGIRPAVGYPSLPDQSLAFLLDALLDFGRIGVRLTESGAMQPHASVCGLMLAHPAARHFAVGPIDRAQFEDYARRRGLPPKVMQKYLAANYTPQTSRP